MEVFPGSVNSSEREPLVSTDSESDDDGPLRIQTYKRRWYILVLFSLVCFTQGLMWNTFGPISRSSERVFGWADSTIAWLSALGGLAFLITSFPVYWLMQVKGLRWAVLFSSASMLVGSALRVIPADAQTTTVLIYFGQFIVGFATPVAMGASPTLSAVWFPQQERVTATAIASSIGVFGVAISFVLGPFIVERNLPPESNSEVNSFHDNSSSLSLTFASDFIFKENSTDPRLEKEEQQIMQYLYIQCAWGGLLFLAILCYFPSAPPQPPSISAYTDRQAYWAGLYALFRNFDFLVLSLMYGFSVGVFGAWQSVLSVNLKPAGISQKSAGWMGFYTAVSGCLTAVFVGRFADRFVRHMKKIIFAMYILATACFTLFSLQLLGAISSNHEGILYAFVICGGTCLLGAQPMAFELGCEIGYPASESATNGMFAFFNNLIGISFMIPFAVPNIGTMWMNWVITGCLFVCLPLISLIKTSFNRLDLDEFPRGPLTEPTNGEDEPVMSSISPPPQTFSSVLDIKDADPVQRPTSSEHAVGYGSDTVMTPVDVHVGAGAERGFR